MRVPSYCAAVLALIIVGVHSTGAQTEANPQKLEPKVTTQNEKTIHRGDPAKDPEAERVRSERRANAQSLLVALAADASKFTDYTLRARTLARIADLLWPVDRDRARMMFRAAWDVADIADKNSNKQYGAEYERMRKSGGGFTTAPVFARVQKEVLRLASRRDRALGEEFLAQLKARQAQDTATTRNTRPLGNADVVTRQRLELARQLLDADDIERALQFADPVLGIIDQVTIEFLSSLREKDAPAADQRYASMLTNAVADPQSDANTVSLLSSYLFTPHVYMGFTSEGTYTNSYQGNHARPLVAPALQLGFFRASATILLRPLAPPEQEQNSAGHDDHYLVIKRLMPLFEQYAPPEMAAALRGQLEALSALVREETRKRDDDDMVRSGIRPDKLMENWEQSLRDQLDHAKTSGERDQINFRLAVLFAGRGELRARDYVDKIDDSEMRQNARVYVDIRIAEFAVNRKAVDLLLEVIRTGEVPRVGKARLFAQAARMLVESDPEKAATLIDSALEEARRLAPSDGDRPRAFFAVANALLVVNRAAVWDAVREAVRAANSAEGFGGEDGQFMFTLTSKGASWSTQASVPEFDVDKIFGILAEEDFNKTVELAGGLTSEAPRAVATIAIARVMLDEKRK